MNPEQATTVLASATGQTLDASQDETDALREECKRLQLRLVERHKSASIIFMLVVKFASSSVIITLYQVVKVRDCQQGGGFAPEVYIYMVKGVQISARSSDGVKKYSKRVVRTFG
eukprot:748433-Hanusia_phi.AAC.3